MKISINGDIIDTKDIYKITKLKSFEWNNGHTWNIPFEGAITNDSCFGFKVKLFNHKKVHVWYNVSDECDDDYKASTDRYEKTTDRKELWEKLEKFRATIVDKWNEDKSDIQQFNFK